MALNFEKKGENSQNSLGTETHRETYNCNNCDWSYSKPSDIRIDYCPHCYQNNTLEWIKNDQSAIHDGTFELVVPFDLSNAQLSANLESFYKGIPFRPKDLTLPKLISRIEQLFIPMWLVDTRVRAKWWAEAGFNYQVVSHQARYDENSRNWTTREVNEGRIRWEPRLGYLNREIHNTAVPALEEQAAIINELGTYSLDRAGAYNPSDITNSIICWPNRDTEDVWIEAQPAIQSYAGEECRRAAGADHIREFKWDPSFENRNWTIVLLPILITFYKDDENYVQPIYINGQTGRTSGKKQASMKAGRKLSLILFSIAVFIGIISLLIGAASIAVPMLLVLGILGFVLALILGLGCTVPLIVVWQFNKDNKSKTIGYFS